MEWMRRGGEVLHCHFAQHSDASGFWLLPNAIAKASHRLNQSLFASLVDFASNETDERIQCVFLYVRLQPPNRFHDGPP